MSGLQADGKLLIHYLEKIRCLKIKLRWWDFYQVGWWGKQEFMETRWIVLYFWGWK